MSAVPPGHKLAHYEILEPIGKRSNTAEAPRGIRLILDWGEALKRLVPTDN